jgi:hypothetical protein
LPDAGAHVRLKIDSKGYMVDLEDVSQSHTAIDRDERTTRLAVLKAAANFLGQFSQCHDGVKSEHVLVLADRWLDWVNRAHDGA